VENYTGDVFGQGGGQALAAEVDAPYLGNMALRSSYRNSAMPTVLADEEVREEYSDIAAELRRSLREFGREAA
jgi:hypothetical protein